eukprot:TRINITY_DN121352_c0_g1_i1.p1 TRINITY_DN121352_c0_g1~~TRINITY_DN121352_c0_g1_i1.p1  ORF type:complete len:278 (+),score=48.53 TRINITY_DN121352_c0_g1_i1:72-836(+)
MSVLVRRLSNCRRPLALLAVQSRLPAGCLPSTSSTEPAGIRWRPSQAAEASDSRRSFGAFSKPQELHRHRKRLEGFARDAPKGDSKTLASCHDLLKDEDWFARKTAVDAIGKVANPGDDQQLEVLYKHLDDNDIFVREAAVDAVAALARKGDDIAVSKIAMRLADEDCFVRTRAVVALGLIGQPGDMETLALLDEMFEDGFGPTRKQAIEAVLILAPPGHQGVEDRLRRAREDVDHRVRDLAKDALARYQKKAG